MSLAIQPYNLSIPSFSPVLTYLPYRDGDATRGWNSSYTDYSVTDALNNQAAVPNGYFRGTGTAFRTTSFTGATVNLNFTGIGIYMCFSTNAPWTFSVDGQQVVTTSSLPDDACAEYGGHASQLSVATSLPQGKHVATLEATAGTAGPLDFYGAVVTLNAGQPGPKMTQVIPDSDQGWNYQGDWVVETDDPYMWNGRYRSGTTYGKGTTASYTFSGASAIILRGLSMANYGPYSITMSGGASYTFNASDTYWRHSETILFFAGGLDSTSSHTIKLTDYDPANPKMSPIGGSTFSSASIGTLTLVMDDTAAREASIPPPSSSVNTGTIAAAVLGALVALLLASNIFFFYLWRRLKKEMQFTRFAATTPEVEKDVLPPAPIPWATSAPPSTTALLSVSAETSSQASSVPPSMPDSSSYLPVARRPEKRVLRAQNQDPVELESLPPHNHQVGTSTADPQVLGELVSNLSTLLNGHLREEYMQRERQHLAGLNEPPEYRDR